MKAITTKIPLKQAVIELTDPGTDPQWEFEDDEYITIRNPLTCPMKYIWDDARRGAELARLPEDDPEKQEFLKQRNHRTLMWSFADWCLYDDEGELIPPVTPLEDESWFSLSPGQQFVLEIIVMNKYYKTPEEEAPAEPQLPITLDEDEDPLLEKA